MNASNNKNSNDELVCFLGEGEPSFGVCSCESQQQNKPNNRSLKQKEFG